MKSPLLFLKLIGVALFICGLPAGAADWTRNLYLHTELGASLVEDVTIKGAAGAKATFDPGVGGTFSLGYHFNSFLAAEFESGVLWNSFDKIGNVSLTTMRASADLFQIPLKLNLVCHVPTKSRWTPYFGGGLGGMVTILEGSVEDNPGPAPATISVIGNSNFSGTDFTFVYQGMVGVKYSLSPHAQIDVGYKFFGTFDHSWSDGSREFKTEPIYTHAFLASFTWRF